MPQYLGDWAQNSTHYFCWDSNDSDGASITRAVDGTISVYKDNNVAQSVAGITDTEDFDGLVGIHLVTIDTSADAFYATGSDYHVVLSAATIDAQTVNAVLAHFSIENRFEEVTLTNGAHGGASAVLTLDNFVMVGTAGPGMSIGGTDHGLEISASAGPGLEIDGTTFGVEIDASAGPGVHVAGTTIGMDIDASAGSAIDIDGTTAGVQINASAGNAVDIAADGGNGDGMEITGNGTGHGISSTGGVTGHGMSLLGGATSGDGLHTEAATLGDGIEAVGAGGGYDINADIQGALSGAVGSVTGAVGSVTGNVGGNVTGSVGSVVGAVGSVTGAVGSVTGNVGGNVTGSVGSVVGAVGSVTGAVGSVGAGGITAASFGANAVDAAALATDAVNEIVDQTWDELIAGHLGAGSTGAALNAVVGGGAVNMDLDFESIVIT